MDHETRDERRKQGRDTEVSVTTDSSPGGGAAAGAVGMPTAGWIIYFLVINPLEKISPTGYTSGLRDLWKILAELF